MTEALRIEALRKTYPNGFHALHGISLAVEEGDFFALLGPNGAGKSTTIGIISSLINKTGGSVTVFGHNIDSDLEAAKRCIGLVPQEFNFNIWEPVEEILWNQAGYYGIPPKLGRARAERYLRQLGLWDKRRDAARELSGGMKRRLMIARALVHRPRLLILDEPTAGVDIELRRSMWDFLREINHAGTTIILTTHYLEEAENLCRTIAIIDEGNIVEHSNMKRLLAKLHTETVILYSHEVIESTPQVPDYRIDQVDETTLEAEIRDHQGISDLLCALAECGIRIKSMRNKTNRLEELFLRLVDKSARNAVGNS